MKDKTAGKAKGGFARAAALSPEQRSEIARRAASSRWDGDLPQATHEGEFRIGSTAISCAVLSGGRRIVTQAAFMRAIGRARSPKAGTGVLSTGVDQLPFFLQAEALKPFIPSDLVGSTNPTFYRGVTGAKKVGYGAELLPAVANVYLAFRDDCLARWGKVPTRYERMVRAADLAVRALAEVGIVALIDEATGYQEVRDRDALQKILDAYIGKELAKWVKTFPEEFYEEVFRLRGWTYTPGSNKRPMEVARVTSDLVYMRLAPGVLEQLRALTPRDEKGRLKNKLHQRLSRDVGHPALKDHLSGLVYLAKASDSWDAFYVSVDRVAPKFGQTLALPWPDDVPEINVVDAKAPLPPSGQSSSVSQR